MGCDLCSGPAGPEGMGWKGRTEAAQVLHGGSNLAGRVSSGKISRLSLSSRNSRAPSDCRQTSPEKTGTEKKDGRKSHPRGCLQGQLCSLKPACVHGPPQ